LGVDLLMKQFIQKGTYDATELDGEWIILNTDDYTITRINEVGGICWSLLSEAQTADSLTHSLLGIYEIGESEELVKEDVEEFLQNLVECGLIHNVNR
jgi:hypothetical protein